MRDGCTPGMGAAYSVQTFLARMKAYIVQRRQDTHSLQQPLESNNILYAQYLARHDAQAPEALQLCKPQQCSADCIPFM